MLTCLLQDMQSTQMLNPGHGRPGFLAFCVQGLSYNMLAHIFFKGTEEFGDSASSFGPWQQGTVVSVSLGISFFPTFFFFF